MEHNDTNPQELLQEAMTCHQQGNLFDADRLYAQVIEQQPTNVQALRLRGILARERGDVESSLQLLHQAASAADQDPDPMGELALTHMAAGRLAEAETHLRQSLDIDPSYLKGLTNLGALLQHRGHLAESARCYRRVLEDEPDNLAVRCNLAKNLSDGGDYAAALDECEHAISSNQRHPHALATRGAVQLDMEDYAGARASLSEAIDLDPYDDMALVNLALACYESGELESATSHLRQALAENPNNARAIADLANCLCADDRPDEAILLCETFLEHYPGERLVIGAYALALHNAGLNEQADQLTGIDTLVQVHELRIDTPGGVESLNAALTTLIDDHPSLISNPVSKSTQGGDQTGELNPAANEHLQTFAVAVNAAIDNAVSRYIDAGLGTHPLMAPATNQRWLRIWGTRLKAGGQQTPHMHPLAWLSGVYYPHLPADMNDGDAQAGWLEFGKPPDRYYRNRAPQSHAFEPQEGTLVLFPSWFWHRTLPFESQDNRYSIAFDVMPHSGLRFL